MAVISEWEREIMVVKVGLTKEDLLTLNAGYPVIVDSEEMTGVKPGTPLVILKREEGG